MFRTGREEEFEGSMAFKGNLQAVKERKHVLNKRLPLHQLSSREHAASRRQMVYLHRFLGDL
jgi:hypothetical protein